MAVFKEEAMSHISMDAIRVVVNKATRKKQMAENHWHNYYEVLYVLSGQARQMIEGGSHDLLPHDIVIIEPGHVHSTAATTKECSILVLHFLPSLLYPETESLYLAHFAGQARLQSGYLDTYNQQDCDFYALCTRLLEEVEQKPLGYRLVTKGLAMEFLGLIQRCEGIQEHVAHSEQQDVKIMEACRYIESNYANPISLEDIAYYSGYTSTYFSRLFKTTTNMNFKQFLDSVRISEAKRLLVFTNYTIPHVGELVGYQTSSSFVRTFKRLTGQTPSEYQSTSPKSNFLPGP